MGVEGLALAISVSATLEVAGLLVALRRRLGRLDGRLLVSSVARSSAATLAAAVVMFVALGVLSGAVAAQLLLLLVPAAAGMAVFLVAAVLFRAPELATVRRLLRNFRG
jgi:peptidoglycan biosynthesis protein MviN/MurJ (putative lipid II flippase)